MMFDRKLKLTLNGLEVGTTPMLLPSVSSRTNLDIKKILEIMSGFVMGPILTSAYDFYHHPKSKEFNLSFTDLIFLDSGGYECNKEQDISDIGMYKPESKKWNKDLYSEVIDKWSIDIPTVLISYDHPSERKPLDQQINDANILFKHKSNFLKELLIKPETKTQLRIKPEKIINNIDSFDSFDIVGFTDKELGYSILQRMTNLSKIRKAMDECGIIKPIHIFGSLDPVTTPLYFVAGADIFDGLSWLRFIFDNGQAYYIDSYGPKTKGAHVNMQVIWGKTISDNYDYLLRLKLDLKLFQSKNDWSIFGDNESFFKKTYEDLIENIGGD